MTPTELARLIDLRVTQRIRERRRTIGTTQQMPARIIGVAFQHAHKYERGHCRISADRLYHIAAALKAPITYFFAPEEAGSDCDRRQKMTIDSRPSRDKNPSPRFRGEREGAGRAMRRLRACSAGAIAVMTALLFAGTVPVIIGFTSLGTEVGYWYYKQRQMQGVADAAAISAAAQYIQDFNGGNPTSTTYQTVGRSYALTNDPTIPAPNVCLYKASGDCSSILSLDARPITCSTGDYCIVAEITQTPSRMFLAAISALTPPTLVARAIVSIHVTPGTTTTTTGTDCILALANDPQAVLVHGNGDIQARCGISVDGGLDQNVSGTPQGGITFNGGPAQVNITSLAVASSSTNCPGSQCFLFSPSTTPLPASDVLTNTATQDPYAATVNSNFPTPPSGVNTGGVVIKTQGSGYTNGTAQKFTVVGGTGTPATFTATVSGGKVTGTPTVTDPGAYTVFPTSPVSVTPATGGGSGATFTLTEGCFTFNGTAIAGRKYCSISFSGNGTLNFPAGSYYIAGGDGSCVGFCVSGSKSNVTSDDAGVTFFLTNGEGTGTYGTSSYATISITSGTVSLCAPGTNTGATTCTGANPGTTCDNTKGTWACMLFVQNPAAPASTSPSTPGNTINSFAGNGTRTLSGLLYLPEQTFSESGNGPILGCFGVVAKYIDVGGTPTFANGCLPGHGIGGTTTTTPAMASEPALSQ